MSWGRTTAVAAFILACGWATMAGAQTTGLLSPAEHNRLVSQVDDRPMVFFVAKGPADSCGPGCDRWIAAEGSLMSGTAKRFEDFLATASRQTLPVFFHSRGGSSYEAFQIGRFLRRHRMTAGVGRTVTERCRVFSAKDKACQHLISSGGDVKAQLNLRDGQCHSACVHAFVGASSRRVAAGAMLGVHSPRFDSKLLKQEAQSLPNAQPLAPADLHTRLQQYLSLMGIDPRLQQTGSKIDTRRLYVLSRDEITRFGIETSDPYESQWFPYRIQGHAGLLKSVSKHSGSDGSAAVHLGCAGSVEMLLMYMRILPDDLKYRPNVSFDLAGGSELPTTFMEQSDLTFWWIVVPVHSVERAAESPAITVIERYSPAADRKSARISISTGGLPAALTNLRKLCTESGEPSRQRAQPPRDSRT